MTSVVQFCSSKITPPYCVLTLCDTRQNGKRGEENPGNELADLVIIQQPYYYKTFFMTLPFLKLHSETKLVKTAYASTVLYRYTLFYTAASVHCYSYETFTNNSYIPSP